MPQRRTGADGRDGTGDLAPLPAAAPPRELELSRFDSGDGEMVVLAFPVDGAATGDALTPAEHAVVAAIEAGMSNAEIARVRGTSARTVANQIASIFRKLKVGSRAELVATRAVLREPSGESPER